MAMSKVASAVHVKLEPSYGISEEPTFDVSVKIERCVTEPFEANVKAEPSNAVRVKEECVGVSAAAAAAGLYADHAVKDELVLGPELVERRVSLAPNGPTPPKKPKDEYKRYQCAHCTYKTSRRKTLVCHLNSTHTGNPFMCDICNYCTDLKDIFYKHLNTHGIKPFQCDLCHYGSSRKKDVLSHKSIHGTKPYKCKHCQYASTHKDALKIHEMLHIARFYEPRSHATAGGLATHELACGLCSFSTFRFKSLEDHRLNEHRIRTYEVHYESGLRVLVSKDNERRNDGNTGKEQNINCKANSALSDKSKALHLTDHTYAREKESFRKPIWSKDLQDPVPASLINIRDFINTKNMIHKEEKL